ncbi:MAG: ABC transporter substrate-binding protein [Clostridiales bacterium]|nr:ABC transporter substrate-binding protein [Clostridiales bacterium]
MKKRRMIALSLGLTMLLSTACGSVEVKEKTQSNAPDAAVTENTETQEPVALQLLCQSKDEKLANIVRDLLTKQGFDVTVNMQTDLSGFSSQTDAGNYDITVSSWGVPNGSPNYAIKALVQSDGSYNYWKYNDAKIDEMIETAAAADVSEWETVYGDLERYLVDDLCYLTPLYREIKGRGVGSELDADSTRVLSIWQDFTYNDASLNTTRPVVHGTYSFSLSTFDPIRADNSSIGTPANNLYIRLIDLTDDYEFTTSGTLSRNYAISEDNQNFYFILRDDCYFTRVDANADPVLTDQMVAGEDVVFSVERMRGKNSVPLHAAYDNFTTIESVEMITDMEELKNTVTADGGSIYDDLNDGLSASLETLVSTRDEVDNAAGSYQVICIRTSYPFPQILNSLCQHVAGIVDSEWVGEINANVNVENYDASKDVCYADTNTMYKGSGFNNTISCSGPYVLTYMDDYGLYMVKNEGYHKEDGGAKISTLNYLTMSDVDACVSALRSGEIDYIWNLSADKYSVVDSDPNLTLCQNPGNRAYYMGYNISENSPCSSENVRKAIAASINQDDIIAGMSGYATYAYSPISAVLDCGNQLIYEEGKAQEYLNAYYAE